MEHDKEIGLFDQIIRMRNNTNYNYENIEDSDEPKKDENIEYVSSESKNMAERVFLKA